MRYLYGSIIFHGVKWRFTYDRRLFMAGRRKEFTGACDLANKMVYVDRSLPPDECRKRLRHELAHAYVCTVYGQHMAECEGFVDVVEKSNAIDWGFLEDICEF